MTLDRVFDAFIQQQHAEARALAGESDLVEIGAHAMHRERFLVRFHCRGLVRTGGGAIVEGNDFAVGVNFPATYLRWVEPSSVLTWFAPSNVWHPNIAPQASAICVGRVAPGTSLVDLVFQCWEIITWNKVTMREDDALNWDACQWARSNRERFPVDRRPLKRCSLTVHGGDHAGHF